MDQVSRNRKVQQLARVVPALLLGMAVALAASSDSHSGSVPTLGARATELGAVNAAASSASELGVSAPARRLLIDEVQPACGEQRAAPDFLSAGIDEVLVVFRVTNPSGLRSRGQSISVELRAASGAVRKRELQVPSLLPGQALRLEAGFDFPNDLASAYDAVAVRSAPGDAPEWSPIAFACVRKCPPTAVVVRKCRNPEGCAELGHAPPGEALACAPEACRDKGPWVGTVAACSLDRVYCSYTREAGGANPDVTLADAQARDVAQLRWFDGEDAEVDCGVVSGQGLDPSVVASLTPLPLPRVHLPDAGRLQLAAATGERLGIPGLDAFLASTSAASLAPPSAVTLAVLDTAAVPFEELSLNDNSEHGRLVGLIAGRVACGDTGLPCPVQIQNRLALPIVQLERTGNGWSMDLDLERGGYLAGRGQIAQALSALLAEWQASGSSAERAPLVANLSFGWHSKHDCAPIGCGDPVHVDRPSRVSVPDGVLPGFGSADRDEASHSLATEAVLLAIGQARCLGALVFAAAGNAVSGDETGALLPAGWSRLPAAQLQCSSTFGLPNPPDLRGGLVSAVAGIDFAANRSALTRMASIPHLAAPAVALAAIDPRAPLGVTGPRSGSSLATAVVSGAAARLWAHLGASASADDVVDALYGGGVGILSPDGTPQPAQLCPGAGPCSAAAREINACSALVALVNAGRLVASNLPPGCPVQVAVPLAASDVVDPLFSSSSDDVEPLGESVDVLEAPYVLSQPWGVVCATCTDLNNLNFASEWQAVFSGAYVDGTTRAINTYYRIRDGLNLTSRSIHYLTQQVTDVDDIPADQCTDDLGNCWRVEGTGYLYNLSNPNGLAARVEVKFESEPVTTTGNLPPLAGDEITRAAAMAW